MISCESIKKTSDLKVDDRNDTFGYIGYRLNFMSFPFILFSLYRYGNYMFAEVSKITGESSAVEVILKLRYVWTVGYFLAVMLCPRFACDFIFAEVPLVVGALFEIYSYTVGMESASFLRLLLLTVITGGLLVLKKRPTWNILLNFWRKSDDEIQTSVVDSSV